MEVASEQFPLVRLSVKLECSYVKSIVKLSLGWSFGALVKVGHGNDLSVAGKIHHVGGVFQVSSDAIAHFAPISGEESKDSNYNIFSNYRNTPDGQNVCIKRQRHTIDGEAQRIRHESSSAKLPFSKIDNVHLDEPKSSWSTNGQGSAVGTD